jgi:hypothetical protein
MKQKTHNSNITKPKAVIKACIMMLALMITGNPETKAQFVPPIGTAGNDTITGSGNFTGSLDATQGGVDTITVAGGSTSPTSAPRPTTLSLTPVWAQSPSTAVHNSLPQASTKEVSMHQALLQFLAPNPPPLITPLKSHLIWSASLQLSPTTWPAARPQ